MPDYSLGALQRPPDYREQKYALARTLPPRAVNLSEPRLLSRWQGRDLRVPVQNQGGMGSCAAWASIKAAMMAATIAGRRDVELLAAGPLYEQARRMRGWFPHDTGSYLADNLDLLLPGGPRVIEPYVADAAHDYHEDSWNDRAARDYAASHRPFYPSEGAFIENVWSALDAGMPVVFGSVWPSQWFYPSRGIVNDGAPFSDRDGGHAYECWGVIPGYFLCGNQWGVGWSADAPDFGWDLRPGDFAIPWGAVDRGLIWEARAVSFEPVPEPPAPEPSDPSALEKVQTYLGYLISGKWARSYVKRSAAIEINRDMPDVLTPSEARVLEQR